MGSSLLSMFLSDRRANRLNVGTSVAAVSDGAIVGRCSSGILVQLAGGLEDNSILH